MKVIIATISVTLAMIGTTFAHHTRNASSDSNIDRSSEDFGNGVFLNGFKDHEKMDSDQDSDFGSEGENDNDNEDSGVGTLQPVPEPSSIALIAFGGAIAGLTVFRPRKS